MIWGYHYFRKHPFGSHGTDLPGWWRFSNIFVGIFTPNFWGRWAHFDVHIFEMGWFNHQLVYCTYIYHNSSQMWVGTVNISYKGILYGIWDKLHFQNTPKISLAGELYWVGTFSNPNLCKGLSWWTIRIPNFQLLETKSIYLVKLARDRKHGFRFTPK